MWVFLIIDACDKMPDARSGFYFLLDTPFNEIVIVVHFDLEGGLNFRWQYSHMHTESLLMADVRYPHKRVSLSFKRSNNPVCCRYGSQTDSVPIDTFSIV